MSNEPLRDLLEHRAAVDYVKTIVRDHLRVMRDEEARDAIVEIIIKIFKEQRRNNPDEILPAITEIFLELKGYIHDYRN